jgi:hypothetical protein
VYRVSAASNAMPAQAYGCVGSPRPKKADGYGPGAPAEGVAKLIMQTAGWASRVSPFMLGL